MPLETMGTSTARPLTQPPGHFGPVPGQRGTGFTQSTGRRTVRQAGVREQLRRISRAIFCQSRLSASASGPGIPRRCTAAQDRGGRDAARIPAVPGQPRGSARPYASRRNDRYDCRAGRRRMGRPTARTLACAASSSGPGRDGAVTVASVCLNALPGNPVAEGEALGVTPGPGDDQPGGPAPPVLENPQRGPSDGAAVWPASQPQPQLPPPVRRPK